MRFVFSTVVLAALSACSVSDSLGTDAVACQAAQTDEQKYLKQGRPGLFPWGPCVGAIIDGQMNDLVRPRRGVLTFEDLSTGGVSRVTVLGDDVITVEPLG